MAFDYFTSKIEIKPQLSTRVRKSAPHYFTSKIEIKPQPEPFYATFGLHYFTSKIEIKPQPAVFPQTVTSKLFYIKDRNQTTTQGW